MSYYFLTGIIFIISLIVSAKLKNKFKKYSQLKLQNGMSGKEIAEKMLKDSGIYDVEVISVEGSLSDHYNPLKKTVNLSSAVYFERNASAAAVAAHECGHAVQHKMGYSMLNLRSSLVPILNISSNFTNIILMVGLGLFYSSGGQNAFVLKLGIAFFALAVIFSFITLPVEFDASRRALAWLKKEKITNEEEYKGSKDALKWAAMTYVVGALGAMTQLIYYISLLNGRRD